MKNILIFSLVAVLFSCKSDKSKLEQKRTDSPLAETAVKITYPKDVLKVFDAHGGLDSWKTFKTLSYVIPKTDAQERHTIALHSRKDIISMPQFSMGFDGSQVWLLDEDESYKGDAIFYHNLMFYFFAMPFVLADEGIVYAETEPLVFEGKSYPGISISYNSGIGTSPKDEYFLHYDPETFQMQWLGYTVTYRSGAVSENVKWIRYNDWANVEGIQLPRSITWYSYEGKDIGVPKSTVVFENISLSSAMKLSDFYKKPEKAKFVN
ncbi:MAG: hypothetical protein ACJART_002519 [Maribacter sp.]|jgi:hypothetical protein